MRNEKMLESFTAYCKACPDQRFWQALRNWCGWPFIYVSSSAPEQFLPGVRTRSNYPTLKDTFYWETNKKD